MEKQFLSKLTTKNLMQITQELTPKISQIVQNIWSSRIINQITRTINFIMNPISILEQSLKDEGKYLDRLLKHHQALKKQCINDKLFLTQILDRINKEIDNNSPDHLTIPKNLEVHTFSLDNVPNKKTYRNVMEMLFYIPSDIRMLTLAEVEHIISVENLTLVDYKDANIHLGDSKKLEEQLSIIKSSLNSPIQFNILEPKSVKPKNSEFSTYIKELIIPTGETIVESGLNLFKDSIEQKNILRLNDKISPKILQKAQKHLLLSMHAYAYLRIGVVNEKKKLLPEKLQFLASNPISVLNYQQKHPGWCIYKKEGKKSSQKLYIAIHGSYTLDDWLTDLSIVPINSNISNLKIHSGFWKAACFIFEEIKEIFNNLKVETIFTINFTGHSLGGAIAILLALMCKQWNSKQFAYKSTFTFGAPNLFYENELDLEIIDENSIYLFVNKMDIVPRLLGSSTIELVKKIGLRLLTKNNLSSDALISFTKYSCAGVVYFICDNDIFVIKKRKEKIAILQITTDFMVQNSIEAHLLPEYNKSLSNGI